MTVGMWLDIAAEIGTYVAIMAAVVAVCAFTGRWFDADGTLRRGRR